MKVAILYDVEGWAYHSEALDMSRYMGIHGISCDIFRYTDFYSSKFKSKRSKYDVVYLYPRQANPITFDPKRTIVKFSSFGDFSKQESLNTLDFAYIVCTNKKIFDRASNHIGHKHSKILSLPLCINHELFYPKDNIDKTSKKLVVGFAGNSKRNGKGFDIIEEAMKKVGSAVTYKTATYHGSDRLTRDKMPDFYRSLDLLICMSTMEGGPLTAFEAGMCGVPTVSGCSSSAINEVTAHNYNGFHIERTADALSKEILRLNKDRKVIITAKQNIAETMFFGHSWKTQSRIYAELLLKVNSLEMK